MIPDTDSPLAAIFRRKTWIFVRTSSEPLSTNLTCGYLLSMLAISFLGFMLTTRKPAEIHELIHSFW